MARRSAAACSLPLLRKPRTTMNTLDQEKAIAEACGVKPELVEWWAHKPDDTGGRICMSAPTKREVEEWIERNPNYGKGYAPKAFYRYPRYPECLNAMRQAETQMAWGRMGNPTWETYVNALSAKVDHPVLLCCASAKERAEVFLRVLGRWIETPATNKEENADVLARGRERHPEAPKTL